MTAIIDIALVPLRAFWVFLTSKLGGPVALAGAALMGVMLIVSQVQNHGLKTQAAQAEAARRIAADNYATCQGNFARQGAALATQTQAVAETAKTMQAQVDAATAKYLTAVKARKAAEARVAAAGAYKTTPGASMCADLMAADAAVMESRR